MQTSTRTRAAMRALATAALVVAVVAPATRATAATVLSARTLACGGTGPQKGSIAVAERKGTLTLRLSGSGLVPGQAVSCGYTCGMVFATGPKVPCGTVGANGRFAGKIELPAATCFGFIPFFDTPTTGKCVPSTVP
jgi:hypothetical protein